MTRRLSLLCACAATCLALAPASDTVSFHPADGSSAAKKCAIHSEFSLGDVSAVVDGQDVSENLPPDLEFAIEVLMEVTDDYVRSGAGRPLELIRSYDELSLEWSAEGGGESQSESADEFAELEGRRVRFRWNDDEKEYDVSFHESEGDPELLEGLGVDMDLLALLPEDEVSEGDRWSVEARELGSVFFFGSDPGKLRPDVQGEGAEVFQQIEAELLPQLEKLGEDFKTECEYKGRREVDGRSLGVIRLALKGDGSMDLASLIAAAIEKQPMPEEVDVSISAATLGLRVEGEGELLWDLEAGHLHAFEMTADIEIDLEFDIDATAPDGDHSAEVSAELLGEATWKVDLAGA